MPSDLCLCMSAVTAWWGIALATIFWKPCLGVEEPENLSQDNKFPYKDFRTNRILSSIIEESIETDDEDKPIDPRSYIPGSERDPEYSDNDFDIIGSDDIV